MGYHDSLNAIKNAVAIERVTVTVKDGAVAFEGDTFKHKDFIKKELRGTNIHWDKDAKAWTVSIDTLYDGDKRLIEEIACVDGLFD